MADLNGDGRDDMIAGSYSPGDLHVFFRNADGKFAASQLLKDAQGNDANAGKPWNNPNAPDEDSLAAAPRVVDWDADGDLDLLVGNIAGRVVLLENVGGPTAPKFTRKGPIRAGGDVLAVDNHYSAPTITDWDRDGRWDLIVGGGAGTVMYFRNEGRIGTPRFDTGVVLLKGRGSGRFEPGEEPEGHGLRAKPHVADWNGDGTLDLLVGDVATPTGKLQELSTEQKVTKDRLEDERADHLRTIARLDRRCDGVVAKLNAADRKAYDTATTRAREIAAELVPLRTWSLCGFVWVYLRKAPPKKP